jgi:hypothetical protein
MRVKRVDRWHPRALWFFPIPKRDGNGLTLPEQESGPERMLAFYQRRRGLEAVLENGSAIYNDEEQYSEYNQIMYRLDLADRRLTLTGSN